jgi:phosphohistidine phosphatase
MKSICIIRHAKSSWDDTELPDVVRPLNPRGKKDARTMGQYLAKLHEKPDLIISSPATRAYHTAIAVAQVQGYRLKHIQIEPAIYYDGEQGVLNLLRNLDDKYESVFLFGHEPTCSDTIQTLTGAGDGKFATGSICKITMDVSQWKDIYDAKGKQVYLVSPKQIKE